MPDKQPIHVDDPIKFACSQVAAQAANWLASKPETEAVLVMHEPKQAVDLKTRERFIEVSADLVRKGGIPFSKQKILKRFYSTIKVNVAKVVS